MIIQTIYQYLNLDYIVKHNHLRLETRFSKKNLFFIKNLKKI
jgi:hypothetical protein